jgi:N-acylneuraminate cytidylyltransferase
VEPPEGSVRRQDYPSNYYCINGAIYIANTDYLLKNRGFLSSNNQDWFVMSRLRGIDVDSMDDLLVAEALLSRTTLDEENTVDG